MKARLLSVLSIALFVGCTDGDSVGQSYLGDGGDVGGSADATDQGVEVGGGSDGTVPRDAATGGAGDGPQPARDASASGGRPAVDARTLDGLIAPTDAAIPQDAATPTPDSGVIVITPDAALISPDARLPLADAHGESPDTLPPSQDAAPLTPDIAEPTRDAAAPTPDAPAVLADVAGEHLDAALPDDALPDAALPPPPPPVVFINEIECHDREYIEFVSAEADAVDLTGFWITDDPADPLATYVFPVGTVLAPDGHTTIYAQTRREDGFTFGISCGNDTVSFFDPDGTLLDAVQVFDFAAATSWGRLPDGPDGSFAPNEPTPAAVNSAPVLPGGDLFDPYGPLGLPIFDLTVDQAGLDSWATGDPRESVPGQFRMTVNDVPGEVLQVGVHLKGRLGSFRQPPAKAAFKVDMNFVVAGQRFFDLKELTFNNMVQDPSMLHEFTAYAIFRAAGVPVPRVGYAWVRLNDADYGLYAQIESYDDVFLDEHFPSTQHLYEGAYGQDLTLGQLAGLDSDEGDPQDRSDLAAIITALDGVPATEGYAATQALIDWDELTNVMATEIYIGHWDGYAPTRNNWFMHTDEDGRLSLMPWGTDQTFSRELALHDGQGRLLRTCMVSAECRFAFDSKLRDLIAVIDTLDLPAQIRALAAALEPAIAADPKRPYTAATVATQVQATIDFLGRRRAAVLAALECTFGPDPDPDGDGFRCDADCGPNDPTVHPGRAEICGDGIDQDCTGRADDAFECPDCVERLHGTHRYLVCPTPRNWEQASTHCAESGSGPLHVDSGDENAWLWAQSRGVANQNWWLGLTDLATEGTFVWADGVAPTYTAWNGGEPNNAGNNEDCGHFWNDRATWNDIPCTNSMGVLCEDPCPPGEDRDGDGAPRCGNDCNDDNPNVRPGLPEICGDRIDQNCDGTVDEGAGCDCVEILRNGRRYAFCDRPRNWADSRVECQRQGMDLVVINDAGENTWVFDTAMSRSHQAAWLGYTDTAVEATWTWVGGAVSNFTRWSGGQPDNSQNNEDCGTFFADRAGVWNDQDCATTAMALCEQREP